MERPVPVGVSLPIGNARSCRPGRTPHETAISQLSRVMRRPPPRRLHPRASTTVLCVVKFTSFAHLLEDTGVAVQTAVDAWVEADRRRRWASLPPGLHALTRSKMTIARAQLADAYLSRRRLCVARRVRRAFLLGKSPTTARSGLRTGSRNRMKDEVFRGSQIDAQYLHLLLRQLEF
jgi:hypothetical protein